MFRFAYHDMIYFFGLLPLFIILYMAMRRWKKKALRKFGDESVIMQLFPDVSLSRPGMKLIS